MDHLGRNRFRYGSLLRLHLIRAPRSGNRVMANFSRHKLDERGTGEGP